MKLQICHFQNGAQDVIELQIFLYDVQKRQFYAKNSNILRESCISCMRNTFTVNSGEEISSVPQGGISNLAKTLLKQLSIVFQMTHMNKESFYMFT